jgi:hypothetical protein
VVDVKCDGAVSTVPVPEVVQANPDSWNFIEQNGKYAWRSKITGQTLWPDGSVAWPAANAVVSLGPTVPQMQQQPPVQMTVSTPISLPVIIPAPPKTVVQQRPLVTNVTPAPSQSSSSGSVVRYPEQQRYKAKTPAIIPAGWGESKQVSYLVPVVAILGLGALVLYLMKRNK